MHLKIKKLDEKFTKNQLLKNIYQPNSVQYLIPTKKSKIQQDISAQQKQIKGLQTHRKFELRKVVFLT
jgi:hypothetical protein